MHRWDGSGVGRPLLTVTLIATVIGCEGRLDRPSQPARVASRTDAVTVITVDGSRRLEQKIGAAGGDWPGAPDLAAAATAPPEDPGAETASRDESDPLASPPVRSDPDPGDAASPPVAFDATNDAEHPAITWMSGMSKLVRDLEFTPGLREPPQQMVLPAPAPWTPPPEASSNPAPIIEAISPPGGRAIGGEPVTIRGRNLDAMQVLFGLAPAAIVRQGPEALVVATPPGPPGDTPVVVTNRDGNYAIAASAYRYLP